MLNRTGKLQIPLILLALLLAILAPVVAGGYLHIQKAQAAFAKRDFISAGQHFERAAGLLPWKPQLWDRAGFSYSIAAQLAPDDAQALDSLGWPLAQAGKFSDAAPLLMAATLLDPGSPAAHLHLAQAYLRQGDTRSALVELQLAFQVDPGGAVGQSAWQLLTRYSQ